MTGGRAWRGSVPSSDVVFFLKKKQTEEGAGPRVSGGPAWWGPVPSSYVVFVLKKEET